jgi:outer membrane receptor for ferrienterochelin and colicin
LRSADGTIVGRNVRVARYTPTHARSFRVDGSLEYKLSPSADLGADFSLERSSPDNRIDEHRIDYDAAGAVTAEYDRVRTGVYYNRSHDASVYYQQRGSQTRDSLKIVAQSGRSSIEFDRPFVITYIVPMNVPSGERIYNRYVSSEQRLAIDYEKPLGKRVRLSLGSELKRIDIRQDNGRASIDPATAEGRSLPPVLYRFEARQKSAAAYATLQARLGHWTLQAGERGQIVTIDPQLLPDTPLPRRRIRSGSHSLSVIRDLGAGQVSAKLNRTLQLFDPRDLNPLVTYVDPVSRSVGNPTLLPQKVLSAEAGYSLGRGAWDVSASVYYKRVDDILVDYNAFLADNVQVGAKQNSGSASSYGVEASLSDALNGKLKYSLTGNLFQSTLPVLDGNRLRQTGRLYSYIVQASLDWKPNRKDQIHLDGRLQGPTLVPQGVRSGTGTLNLVWRHTLSPRLTLSLTGQNVVQRTYVTTRIDAPTAFDVSRSLNGRQAIFVGIRYKIR